jgi:hypothetical protein
MLIFTFVDHTRSLLVDVPVFDLGTDYLITRLERKSISFNYNILEQGKFPNRNAIDLQFVL